MTEFWFYHMQQSPLEQVLPDILEKTYAKGWKTLVKIGPLRGDAEAELKRLDDYLWTYRKDAFLPHGRDDEPLADHQPICLAVEREDCNGSDVVILLGGADTGKLDDVTRCITLLDGADEHDRKIARLRWKTAKDDGYETAYWRQNDHGKWVQPDL